MAVPRRAQERGQARASGRSDDRYAYSGNNLIEHIRPDDGIVRFEYDDQDQLVRTIDPAGNVVEETDPKGNKTRYRYNSQGLPVEVQDAKGGKKTLAYARTGNC